MSYIKKHNVYIIYLYMSTVEKLLNTSTTTCSWSCSTAKYSWSGLLVKTNTSILVHVQNHNPKSVQCPNHNLKSRNVEWLLFNLYYGLDGQYYFTYMESISFLNVWRKQRKPLNIIYTSDLLKAATDGAFA